MEYVDHIKNIIKDALKSPPAIGEDLDEYLTKKANLIMSYIPAAAIPAGPTVTLLAEAKKLADDLATATKKEG